jgi:hypothetical protein
MRNVGEKPAWKRSDKQKWRKSLTQATAAEIDEDVQIKKSLRPNYFLAVQVDSQQVFELF